MLWTSKQTKGNKMWYETPTTPAPEGVKLLTKIHDNKGSRNEQELIRKGNLWWFTDMSMYVYYTPTHWKYI